MVERARLESECTLYGYRGFESHPLRGWVVKRFLRECKSLKKLRQSLGYNKPKIFLLQCLNSLNLYRRLTFYCCPIIIYYRHTLQKVK